MPIFIYQGRDNHGNLKKGKRLAPSADMLSKQLMQEGVTPIEIFLAEKAKNFGIQLKNRLFAEPPSLDELGMFARQMHVLCKTGVPLSGAMTRLADGTQNKMLAKALRGIVESLESGQDLALSMQSYSDIFSPLMISIVRVGQSSGRLDEAFLRINQYIELESNTTKNIRAAMRYPLLVLIAVIAGIVLINIFVIPAFSNVFAQAHIQLPFATRFLIGMSNFMTHHWIILSVIIAMLVSIVWRYLHTPSGKLRWHQYQIRIPIVGNMLKRIILLRFAQSFGMTIKSGVPLVEGIGLIANSINNEYAKHQILSMRESIERGNTLTQAATLTHLFSPLELQMLSVSEETGELGPMLEQIASFHKREVEYDIKRLSDTVEPLLVAILAIMILIVALAVYLPIWDMVKLAHAT